MTKIISVLNHKGGVGKTTTTASLTAGLSKLGYKSLAIDMDGQANLTSMLGVSKTLPDTIYSALKGQTKHLPIYNGNGVKIVPSTLDLQAAELELSSEPGRELLLNRLIKPIMSDYDYIIIDCPPSLGLLTLNALTTSTDLIIPVEAEPLALQGMGTILNIIDKVKTRLNDNLKLMGILITKYDQRKTINKEVLETIIEYYPKKVFRTIIRDNVKLAELGATHNDIFSHAPNSTGAEDYLNLSKEIINH